MKVLLKMILSNQYEVSQKHSISHYLPQHNKNKKTIHSLKETPPRVRNKKIILDHKNSVEGSKTWACPRQHIFHFCYTFQLKSQPIFGLRHESAVIWLSPWLFGQFIFTKTHAMKWQGIKKKCLQITVFTFKVMFRMLRRSNEVTTNSVLKNNEGTTVPLKLQF